MRWEEATIKFPEAFDSYRKKYKQKQYIYGAIIRNTITNEYLLVKGKQSGKYSFPKGHIESNETPIECIFRELYEETGININKTHNIMPKEIVRSRIGTYIYFETDKCHELIANDKNEIEHVGWYEPNKLKSLSLNADASYYLRLSGVF
jgi:8-oxo-dGTP pyrophosphatase MutT (NUDIX family)